LNACSILPYISLQQVQRKRRAKRNSVEKGNQAQAQILNLFPKEEAREPAIIFFGNAAKYASETALVVKTRS